MTRRPTHYRVLQLRQDATSREIVAARTRLLAAASTGTAEERAAIEAAYATLADPGRRARYDLWLDRRGIRVVTGRNRNMTGSVEDHLAQEHEALQKVSIDLRRSFAFGVGVEFALVPTKVERFFMVLDDDEVLFIKTDSHGMPLKTDPRLILPRPDRPGPAKRPDMYLQVRRKYLQVVFGRHPFAPRALVSPSPRTPSWTTMMRMLRRGGVVKRVWYEQRWW